MRPTVRTLIIGVSIGLIIGGMTVTAVPLGAPLQSEEEPTHQTSYSSAGPSCYDETQTNSGWLHVMANGESWAITLETTILHPKDEVVEFEITERPTGTYEIAFVTVESDSTTKRSDKECRTATTFTVATSLERPDFDVTFDGRTIHSVNQDDTMPELYQLPHPLNASNSGEQ